MREIAIGVLIAMPILLLITGVWIWFRGYSNPFTTYCDWEKARNPNRHSAKREAKQKELDALEEYREAYALYLTEVEASASAGDPVAFEIWKSIHLKPKTTWSWSVGWWF